MNNKVLGGLILVFVLLVAVASVILYNSHPNTSVVNNTTGNTTNSANNTLPSSNSIVSILSLENQPSSSSIPVPSPNPTPNPMDNIVDIFDAYVKSIYPQTGVPGAAIVIVQNDKIIYLNTLGVRDVKTGAPVNINTLFQLASCTKAFTSTNVAQLVDQGLMNWNDKIIKYYPSTSEFKLYSRGVTREVTLTDVLCQRVGLYEHAGDEFQLFNYTDYDKSLYKVRYFKNASKFRTTFSYNNILYALAGESAARAGHKDWSEMIKKDLLKPLNMDDSVATYEDFMKADNRIHTYIHIGNVLKERVPIEADCPPSGGISLSISDIANWLSFQIRDDGTYNGKRIVSKKNLDVTRTGLIKQNSNSLYAFGWNVNKDMISHTGSMYYSNSVVSLFPRQKIGIAVLTNEGTYGTAFVTALNFKLNDLLKGIKSTNPWPEWKKNLMPPSPLPNPPKHVTPSKILNTYTGVYSNPVFGRITVTKNQNTLFCYYGNNHQPFDLKHWNGDVFIENNYNQAFNFTSVSYGTTQKLTTNIIDYTNSTFPRAVFQRKKVVK